MSEVKHTPTPLMVVIAPSGTPDITDVKGDIVAAVFGSNAKQKAAHIVKCVNIHDELVGVLSKFMDFKDNDYVPNNMFKRAEETLKKAGVL